MITYGFLPNEKILAADDNDQRDRSLELIHNPTTSIPSIFSISLLRRIELENI